MANTDEDLGDESGEILDFARRWYPYGGGSAEDILLEFGIAEQEYFRRLAVVLDGQSFDPADRVVEAIRAVVAARQVAAGQ